MDRTTCERVIERASQALAILDAEHPEKEARLAAIDAKLATLLERAKSRASRLADAHATQAQARDSHAQCLTRHTLLEGPGEEAQAAAEELKRASEYLRRVEKDTGRLQKQFDGEEQAEKQRRTELEAEQEECQRRLNEIKAEWQRLVREKESAEREIGEHEYRDITEQLLLCDKRVEADERQLKEGKAARMTVGKQGMERLAPWPHLQVKLAAELPRQGDAVDEALTTVHDYVSKMATLRHALPQSLHLPTTSRWLHSWFDVLVITPRELLSPDQLRNHLNTLQQIRSEYRQSRQQNAMSPHGSQVRRMRFGTLEILDPSGNWRRADGASMLH